MSLTRPLDAAKGTEQPLAHFVAASDAVSYDVGKHQFRFGGEYRKAQLDEFYFRNALGSFNFDGSQGVDHKGYPVNPNAYGLTVKALADFLAGEVDTSSFASGDAERMIYVNSYDLFAQTPGRLPGV